MHFITFKIQNHITIFFILIFLHTVLSQKIVNSSIFYFLQK